MVFDVRAMQKDDIDSVYAIELVAHRAPWTRKILSDCVAVGYDCRVLVIKKDNHADVELASYIICRYHDAICHVLNLCVAPALQRQGYGQLLLQHVIDLPAKPGIESMLLEVRPSNFAALALYQKIGFHQVAVKRGYYRDEPNIEDAIVLQKQMVSQCIRGGEETQGPL